MRPSIRARAKVHLQINDEGLTHCGRTPSQNLLYTKVPEYVTCRMCNGMAAESQRGPRKGKRATPDPGPQAGLGKLRCVLCGRPYRDHPVGQFCNFGLDVGGEGR